MTVDPRIVGADIETASEADINVGAWAYSQHPSTIVHCVSFALCEGADKPRIRIDWHPGEKLDDRVRHRAVMCRPFVAHNCLFEWSIWTNILVPQYGFPTVLDTQWLDTQARAVSFNLPHALEGVAKALGCEAQKDLEGAKLMKQMAKATPDGEGGWIYDRDPARLARLTDYCWGDVDSMMDVFYRLPAMHPFEAAVWVADQEINRRGLYLDQRFAAQCLKIAEQRRIVLTEQVKTDTNDELSGVTSVPALKKWVTERGIVLPKVARRKKDGTVTKTETLAADVIADIIKAEDTPEVVRTVLAARAETGKLTSLAKLKRVASMVGSDGRLRGALRYQGAHTGRWASSGLQVHNLPKNKLDPQEVELAMLAIEQGDLELLQMFTHQPLSYLSQCLRSVITAAPGKDLIAADYSSIEARVIAWLAGQEDILQVFREGRDVYTYAANKVGSDDRQFGKVMTLALGFGMGDVKFHSTAAGWGTKLTLKEARKFKRAWREANTEIVSFWYALENAALTAVQNPGEAQRVGKYLTLVAGKQSLRILLPCGRSLYYHRPHIKHVKKKFQVVNEDGEIETKEMEGDELRFFTVGKDRKSMVPESTYGGKLSENVTQAIARDLLAAALVRLQKTEYKAIVHVHDSVAAEVPEGTGDVKEFERLIAQSPAWAAGLPIAAEGYRSKRFKG